MAVSGQDIATSVKTWVSLNNKHLPDLRLIVFTLSRCLQSYHPSNAVQITKPLIRPYLNSPTLATSDKLLIIAIIFFVLAVCNLLSDVIPMLWEYFRRPPNERPQDGGLWYGNRGDSEVVGRDSHYLNDLV